jgi:hypothetical protein
VPPAARERLAPAEPGRNSPHLQKSGFTFCPGIRCRRGRDSRLLREVRCTGVYLFAPFVYLRCTWVCFSAGPGRARPPHGGGLLTVLTFTRRGPGGACALRADAGSGPCRKAPRWRPWSAEGTPAAGAVCSRGSAARRMCRDAGGGSTGTAKTWQPTGDGFAGHGQACSRPARSPGLRRTARCRRGGPPAGFPGQGPKTVSRTDRPFSRIRQPAAIPRRQLICLLIRLPADSGAPFQRRTRLDTARINLPVNSQTDISAQLLKQW